MREVREPETLAEERRGPPPRVLPMTPGLYPSSPSESHVQTHPSGPCASLTRVRHGPKEEAEVSWSVTGQHVPRSSSRREDTPFASVGREAVAPDDLAWLRCRPDRDDREDKFCF